jgi:hypothetical protein
MVAKYLSSLTAILLSVVAVSAYGQYGTGSATRTFGQPLAPRISRSSTALQRASNGEFVGRAVSTPTSGRFGPRTLGQPLGPKARPAATGIERNPSGELVGRAVDRTMFPQSARRLKTAADVAPLPAGFVVEPIPQVVTPTEVYVMPVQVPQQLPAELPPAEEPPVEEPPVETPAEGNLPPEMPPAESPAPTPETP